MESKTKTTKIKKLAKIGPITGTKFKAPETSPNTRGYFVFKIEKAIKLKTPTKREDIIERKNQNPTFFWHFRQREIIKFSSSSGKSKTIFRSTSLPSNERKIAIETTKTVEAIPPKIDTTTLRILDVIPLIVDSITLTKLSKF